MIFLSNIWLHIEILLYLIADFANVSDFYFIDFIVIVYTLFFSNSHPKALNNT